MKYSSSKRDFLQFQRQLEQTVIMQPEFAQHFMAGFAHQFCARIEILVYPVAKSHQPERVIFVFSAVDIFADARLIADFFQHIQAGFICSAVCGPPKQAIPAEMQAKGLAPLEPASRTVEVEAFCS